MLTFVMALLLALKIILRLLMIVCIERVNLLNITRSIFKEMIIRMFFFQLKMLSVLYLL